MMRSEYRHAPARLLALFGLVGIILLGGAVWAGWRLIEQDRRLESERIRERLESSASLVCRELERTLAECEQTLRSFVDGDAFSLPAGAVIATFDRSGIIRHQGDRLLYQPTSLPVPETGIFAAAEVLEFRQGDCAKAAALYRDLAQNGDRTIKAGALMRLARCQRKQNRLSEALATYAQLALLGDAPVAGLPAGLLARRERIALYQTLGDREGSRQDTGLLALALNNAEYRIDRATYEFFRECLTEQGVAPANDREQSLAEAVSLAWAAWRETPDTPLIKVAWRLHGGSFAGIVLTTPEEAAALVMGFDQLLKSAAVTLAQLGVRAGVDDGQGRLIWGELLGDASPQVAKTSLETGLPWNVRVASAGSPVELTTLEYKLLAAFVRRAGQMLTRQQLLDEVWGAGTFVTERVVDNQVTNLRKKIEPDPDHPRYIINLRGLGYRFDG